MLSIFIWWSKPSDLKKRDLFLLFYMVAVAVLTPVVSIPCAQVHPRSNLQHSGLVWTYTSTLLCVRASPVSNHPGQQVWPLEQPSGSGLPCLSRARRFSNCLILRPYFTYSKKCVVHFRRCRVFSNQYRGYRITEPERLLLRHQWRVEQHL